MSAQEWGGGIRTSDLRFIRRGPSRLSYHLGTINCISEVILVGFIVQGFFNFTSRRPRHLLHILELGYNVMYNDVDMVWLADPFPYLQGHHDVYFTDDMAAVGALICFLPLLCAIYEIECSVLD
jgi:hypothetical protein